MLHFLLFPFSHFVQKGGGTIDLEPCLTHTSTVEPTLAPVAVERTMTTRAAASVLHHLFFQIQPFQFSCEFALLSLQHSYFWVPLHSIFI